MRHSACRTPSLLLFVPALVIGGCSDNKNAGPASHPGGAAGIAGPDGSGGTMGGSGGTSGLGPGNSGGSGAATADAASSDADAAGASGSATAGADSGFESASGAGAGGANGGDGGRLLQPIRADAPWNSPSNGNPFIPGYFANPSIFYDAPSAIFYLFAQTDGQWIDFAAEPTVWYSPDFVRWKPQPSALPSIWPGQGLRAPSVMKHPSNGKYYLVYTVGSGTQGTYIAYSGSPLGPWLNATPGTTTATAPLFKAGEMWGTNDWIDAQFFVDDDNSVYLTFGGSHMAGIAKLAFSPTFLVSIDNSDARMTDGSIHKFKLLSGLTNYLEASCMFKNGGRYFMTYSNSACQNYDVQYAVASSPVGPFVHMTGDIVQRDDSLRILGPGHNSILQYGNNWYIVYHQQLYQYVDVKRQLAIGQITFNGEQLSTNIQTSAGVWAGTGALEALVAGARAAAEPNLAFGAAILASSESDYKGGTSVAVPETFAPIPNFYSAGYAVDQNNETRWAPATLPGNIIVDLGADRVVGRCETTFEYVLRAYRYRIEYLAESESPHLTDAQRSAAWHMYADRSSNTEKLSPIADSGRITARYLRVTVLSADIPTAPAQVRTIVETDYADRVSIVEFKVFENVTAP